MTARRPPKWKRLLAAFDARGATYAELAERPGWYVVEWYEPGYPQPDGASWRQVYRPDMPRLSQRLYREVARRAAGKVTS
jgi:hypothetical protein